MAESCESDSSFDSDTPPEVTRPRAMTLPSKKVNENGVNGVQNGSPVHNSIIDNNRIARSLKQSQSIGEFTLIVAMLSLLSFFCF